MGKVLVVYFSASGSTRKVAKRVAAMIGADLYEIRAQIPYIPGDISIANLDSRCNVEREHPSVRPAIVEEDFDFSAYSTVLLGFPIWWEREPCIVDTFLEKGYLSGKRVILFCTAGGNSFGNSVENIKSILGNDAMVEVSRRMTPGIAESDLRRWIELLRL